MTTKKPIESVQELENDIANITVKINEYERDLEQIEIEGSTLLKEWIKIASTDEKSRMKQIDDLNKREEEIEKDYINLRKQKDEKIRELRRHYLAVMKEYHQNANKKGDPKAKKQNAVDMKSIPLERSSLLSGTSRGLEDTEYARIFKNWDINVEFKKIEDIRVIEYSFCTMKYGTLLGKDVLVKTYKSDDMGKIMSARYKALRDILGHRNLLNPIGRLGNEKTSPVQIVLEHPSKNSLQNSLHLEFSFRKRINIARSICEAMAWLHKSKEKTLHLRLRPSNILFTPEWNVKVADYGLGLPPHPETDKANEMYWFQSKLVHYSAPEILESATVEPTDACDVWSFGMLLITLFNGKEPFSHCKNYEAVKGEIKAGKFPIPSDLPIKLKTLIQKCLARNPEDRQPFKDMAANKEGGSIWEDIIQDMAVNSNKEINDICAKAIKGAQVPGVIPWSSLKQALGFNGSKAMERCVQFYFGAKVEDIVVEGKGDNTFNKATIEGLLRVFRPFERATFPDACEDLCKKSWFYGLIERTDIEVIMNQQLANHNTKNLFAVRNSARAEYAFTLCILAANTKQLSHVTIDPKQYEKEGIVAFMEKYAKEKGLRPVDNPDRKVKQLFDTTSTFTAYQTPGLKKGRQTTAGSTWGSTSSVTMSSKVIL